MSKKILVVAAHADDELMGCGGTMARHSDAGDLVSVVFMTNGVGARDTSGTDDQRLREQAARQALSLLNVHQIEFLDFPDNQMDSLPLLEIVRAVESIVERVEPAVIYTHHAGDLNVDHQLTHRAVMTACRPLPGASVQEIRAFEVLSSSEWAVESNNAFVPNTFVDINAYLDIKMQAAQAYDEEMREPPHTRSYDHLRNLARHRGNSVGLDAAEAFISLRRIVK